MADVQQLKCGKCDCLYFAVFEDGVAKLWCPACMNGDAFVQSFDKFAMPLISNEVVSVQPMTGPTSMVYYLDFLYGSMGYDLPESTEDVDFPIEEMIDYEEGPPEEYNA